MKDRECQILKELERKDNIESKIRAVAEELARIHRELENSNSAKFYSEYLLKLCDMYESQ